MITSKRKKIVVGLFFVLIGYGVFSYALFLGLQVDTVYGSVAFVSAVGIILVLIRIYNKITK